MELATNGGLDQDYISLLDVLRTGEDIQHLGPNHPARLYVKVFGNLSVMDLPTGGLVILDGRRIVIPKVDRAQILASLHQFHFSEIAMISQAKTCVFWPSLMLDIKNLWERCLTCQTLCRAHTPSIPLNKDMSNHQVMEVLSAEWGLARENLLPNHCGQM